MKKIIFPLCVMAIALLDCKLQQPQETFILVENENGPTLGYSPQSGIKLLESDGLKFKDLNKNGILDKYEDWRLSVDKRTENLASLMSIEQISGLMLYSRHQTLPSKPLGFGFAEGTYDGHCLRQRLERGVARRNGQGTLS